MLFSSLPVVSVDVKLEGGAVDWGRPGLSSFEGGSSSVSSKWSLLQYRVVVVEMTCLFRSFVSSSDVSLDEQLERVE